ncbi:RYamide receptor-like isoform X3 [Haliotis cracherodii]|uniref:RYamide receptor-like isoform X3 n=1 Tax=Haliotis cracherodii TaxID=6455 RepID=UPI0039EA37DF
MTTLNMTDTSDLALTHAALISLCVVIALLGSTGNILILHIYTHKIRLPVFGFFVRALATLDLANSLYTIPSVIIFKVVTLNEDNQNALCKFVSFTNHHSMLTTGMLYIGIAVQRFQKINRPHGPQMTANKARRIVAICMTFSLLVSIPIILLVERFPMTTDSRNITACNFNNITFKFIGDQKASLLLSVWVSLELVVITGVLVVMYCLISKALRGYTNLSVTCGENLLKPTTAFSILTVIYFCCGIPITLLCFYCSMKKADKDIEPWKLNLVDLALHLPFINCVVNPFVYSFSSGRFRSECKSVLCGRKARPVE